MGRPAWFDEALREMRESGRAGLVVVADAEGYLMGIGENLQGALSSGQLEALRRRAVLMFLPSTAADCIPGLPEGHGLALLDAGGRLLRSSKGEFPAALEALLRKEDVEKPAPVRELPYGVEWAEGQHHELFGTRYDPCPACGMPRMSNNQSRLIRYLRLLDK